MPQAVKIEKSPDYALLEAAFAALARQPRLAARPELLARFLDRRPEELAAAARRWSGATAERLLALFSPGALARRRLEPPRRVGLRQTFSAGGPTVLLEVVAEAEAAQTLRYGYHATPFGPCLLGVLADRVCWLSFRDETALVRARRELFDFWRGVPAREDAAFTARWVRAVFAAPGGRVVPKIPVAVRGTPFQIAVWEALLTVPPGAVCSYGALARAAGRPGAARAAGNAVAANPVSFLIPCHRVVPQGGGFGNYGGGALRKRALLAWEAARFPAP